MKEVDDTRVQQPAHDAERGFHQETTHGPDVTYVDKDTGAPVYAGPVSSVTRPVGERYCAHCGAWQPQDGILAVVVGRPVCGTDWDDAPAASPPPPAL